jgi:adenylate cyclase
VEATLVGIEPRAEELHSTRAVERARRAVLVIDIVESVRLIEEAEASIVSRWLQLVEHVKTQLLPQCNGRLVKILGDGMLLDFEDVRSAVSAAFAIQHANNRENVGLPAEQQIFLRMGLEISDVIVEHDDIYGRGVNLAARLMTLAGPGEIVISTRARDQLTAVLDADIEDLGDCFLKHLSQPVRAYRIGPPGPHLAIDRGVPMSQLAPSIAVVPFSTRRGPADHDMLGEVLADQVIRTLSHVPELSVISRLSTTAFRGRDATLTEISAHLSADYVLSGVYSSDGRQVTLDAELAEAKSGRILWTERLKDRVACILSGEQELIGRLVAEVGAAVIARELQRTKSQPLPTLKTYTLLMGAIALMHRLSLRDFEEARHLLQTVIDRGSRQAIPQAWLANWHVLRVQQGWSIDQNHDAYLALECTQRALDADPDCSLALAIDGFVHTNLLKKLDVAQERYDLAIRTNPNESLAWLLKGTLHAFMGDGDEAVAATQRALRLSPLDPHRYFYESLAATAHLAARQYDRALQLAQSSLRANRTHTSTLRAQAIAQWRLGLHEDARRTTQELLRLEPNLTIDRWRQRSPAAAYRIGAEWAEALREAGVPT